MKLGEKGPQRASERGSGTPRGSLDHTVRTTNLTNWDNQQKSLHNNYIWQLFSSLVVLLTPKLIIISLFYAIFKLCYFMQATQSFYPIDRLDR